jgi:hypothetical protein
MYASKNGTHAIGGRHQLLEVADIGPDTQGGTTGMLDFEFSQVEFGLAPRQQTNPGARGRKSQSQALPNAPASSGNQYTFIFERIQFP